MLSLVKNIFPLIPEIQVCFYLTGTCGLADLERFKNIQIEEKNTLVWDNPCQITIDEISTPLEDEKEPRKKER